MVAVWNFTSCWQFDIIFSRPGQSPGRAIVLLLALALASVSAVALAKSLTLKLFM